MVLRLALNYIRLTIKYTRYEQRTGSDHRNSLKNKDNNVEL